MSHWRRLLPARASLNNAVPISTSTARSMLLTVWSFNYSSSSLEAELASVLAHCGLSTTTTTTLAPSKEAAASHNTGVGAAGGGESDDQEGANHATATTTTTTGSRVGTGITPEAEEVNDGAAAFLSAVAAVGKLGDKTSVRTLEMYYPSISVGGGQ